MEGIENHGFGWGCAMRGVTSGDTKYLRPFGSFAWIAVPSDRPGLGIESLNEELIKQHLHPDHPGYFLPTPEWDKDRVNDRLWS